jgi:hypothetical protein
MLAMVAGSPFWQTKGSRRFWNYTRRFIVKLNQVEI